MKCDRVAPMGTITARDAEAVEVVESRRVESVDECGGRRFEGPAVEQKSGGGKP